LPLPGRIPGMAAKVDVMINVENLLSKLSLKTC
jgi:hypothetical protein